jgi:succinate-acetate transporter protein
VKTKSNPLGFNALLIAFLLLSCSALSGCAALLIAGGAVGGYAIAKQQEEAKNSKPQGFFKK